MRLGSVSTEGPVEEARRPSPARFGIVAGLLVALLLSFLLPSGGVIGATRVVLSGGALLALPGALLIARADAEGDWIVRFVGAVIASIAFYVLVAYLAVAVRIHLSRAVFVLPGLAVSCVLLVGWRRGPSARTSLKALGLTVLLAGGAVGTAIVAHLVLPSTPVESSFSLSAPTATIAGTTVSIPVEIARVHFPGAISLIVYVGNTGVEHETISAAVTHVVLKVAAPPSTTSCPAVSITSNDGAYLSPHVSCGA